MSPPTFVEMTLVFQFMLMPVSLYGLNTSDAPALPVCPPELEPLDEPLLDPLEEPLLDPLEEPLLEPLDEPLLDPVPPGQVAPPGSQPVPQLVVAQW